MHVSGDSTTKRAAELAGPALTAFLTTPALDRTLLRVETPTTHLAQWSVDLTEQRLWMYFTKSALDRGLTTRRSLGTGSMSIQSECQILQAGARSLALQRATLHSARAREMILTETQKFTDQPAPADSVELKIRYLQSEAVTCVKIGGISHGDSTASRYPRAAHRIFDEVTRLCDLPLPKSEEEKHSQYQISSDVTQRIAVICDSDDL